MGFKENLKAELVYQGITVKELAARSGVRKRTIDNYLNAHTCMPSAGAAVGIAKVLGVSVEYLVTGPGTAGSRGVDSLPSDIRTAVRGLELLPSADRQVVLDLISSLKNRSER